MDGAPPRTTTSGYASASTTNADRKPVQLIDIGANLTHDSFDHDRDPVLQRARDSGVVQMVVTGASREQSPQALALARAHPGETFPTAGVHTHHATTSEQISVGQEGCSTCRLLRFPQLHKQKNN